MSYFAQIDENDIVVNVIVVERECIEAGRFGDPKFWVETDPYTSHNVHYGRDNKPDGGTPLRGNAAARGQKYDRVNDVFYPVKIFPSWVMNSTDWSWEPPIPKPDSDTIQYVWDETTRSWVDRNSK